MNSPAVPAPGRAPDGPALDELMLTMDLVDSMRHEQALATAALDDAGKEQALVDQVRRTYAAQGIEVSDQVIADAVQALRDRRFQFQPTPRGWQANLARAYVSRNRWGPLVIAFALVVAFVGFGSHVIRGGLAENRLGAATAVVADLERASEALADSATRTANAASALRDPPPPPSVDAMLVQAHALASDVAERAAAVATPLPQALPTRAEDFVPGAFEQVAQHAEERMDALRSELAQAQDTLARGQQLLRARTTALELHQGLAGSGIRPVRERADLLRQEVDSAIARADVEAAQAAVAALETLASQAGQRAAVRLDQFPAEHRALAGSHVEAMDAALAAGQPTAFAAAAAMLDQLATQLRQAYTLRIVSRPGEQSGVWRHPDGNRDARNYYIVVDAIGADGRRVQLPVINEETGRTEHTATFAVRVPEAVYEAVKADKLDNGLVDDATFGEKRAGELEVRYALPVSGGAITRW